MEDKRKDKPKHLGRGLESLIGPITIDSATTEFKPAEIGFDPNSFKDKVLQARHCELPIDSVLPNPFQPRTVWNEQELSDLAESVKVNGIIQPILVRLSGSKYELIAGERRLRAAEIAGLKAIPAIVRQATQEQMLEWALVENIHRTNLNPLERAHAYQKYITIFSMTQVEAAARLGEDRSVIANHLRLLDLPEEIKEMLASSQLSMGHARAILSLPTDELRRKLANRALAGRLSVREVERLVKKYLASETQVQQKPRFKASHILDLENELSRILGTRVSIETRRGGQRGRIVVEFASLDEFDRITSSIGLSMTENH